MDEQQPRPLLVGAFLGFLPPGNERNEPVHNLARALASRRLPRSHDPTGITRFPSQGFSRKEVTCSGVPSHFKSLLARAKLDRDRGDHG